MESFLRYYGGKKLLSDKIISMIPKHRTYIEIFCGGSWILFNKPKSNIEFINDIDKELINLYYVIKYKLNEFIKELDLSLISEELFNDYRAVKGIPISDLKTFLKNKGIPKLATITYYQIMNSFNGNISNKLHFSIDKFRVSSFVRFYKTNWLNIKNRLKEVSILNRDFRNIFELMDHKESFFYIDPPYLKSDDNYYKHYFKEKDHLDLLELLKNISGKFILTYDNSKKIRRMYKEFNILELENNKELIITNYEAPAIPYFIKKGIPHGSMGIKKSNWNYSNCPYCESRNTKKMYERITLNNGSRSFKARGFICNNCNNLFNPEKLIESENDE